jgi:UDP-glucuronate decarboxylase
MDDGRVVSNSIVQALNNEAITIYGDGSQTRAFCFVDDMIEGMVRLMNTPEDFTGPVNLGNPDVFTIRMLADLVIELCGSNSKIEFKPLPSDDPSQRQPDITLAREALGWEPGTELRDGRQKTITYFDSLLRSPDYPTIFHGSRSASAITLPSM